MTLSKTNEATQRIQFRYYAYIAGPMGDVFRFLLRNKAHSKMTGKKMALDAISAFWKPFSARAILDVSEQEAKVIALHSIDELQQQIDLIKTAFDLKTCSRGVTRREIEEIIDSRLDRERRIPSEALSTPVPIPDNYNVSERTNRTSY